MDMYYDWKTQCVWTKVEERLWIKPIEVVGIDRNELERKTLRSRQK